MLTFIDFVPTEDQMTRYSSNATLSILEAPPKSQVNISPWDGSPLYLIVAA